MVLRWFKYSFWASNSINLNIVDLGLFVSFCKELNTSKSNEARLRLTWRICGKPAKLRRHLEGKHQMTSPDARWPGQSSRHWTLSCHGMARKVLFGLEFQQLGHRWWYIYIHVYVEDSSCLQGLVNWLCCVSNAYRIPNVGNGWTWSKMNPRCIGQQRTRPCFGGANVGPKCRPKVVAKPPAKKRGRQLLQTFSAKKIWSGPLCCFFSRPVAGTKSKSKNCGEKSSYRKPGLWDYHTAVGGWVFWLVRGPRQKKQRGRATGGGRWWSRRDVRLYDWFSEYRLRAAGREDILEKAVIDRQF